MPVIIVVIVISIVTVGLHVSHPVSVIMVYSDCNGTGTGKDGSLYIMPNLHTAPYVGPGPVPIL